jgi:hypothetical protein
MVTFKENQLVITMHETSPQERQQWLIRAIAASMRWEASCDSGAKYNNDGENKIVLAQLLEELIDIEKSH